MSSKQQRVQHQQYQILVARFDYWGNLSLSKSTGGYGAVIYKTSWNRHRKALLWILWMELKLIKIESEGQGLWLGMLQLTKCWGQEVLHSPWVSRICRNYLFGVMFGENSTKETINWHCKYASAWLYRTMTLETVKENMLGNM